MKVIPNVFVLMCIDRGSLGVCGVVVFFSVRMLAFNKFQKDSVAIGCRNQLLHEFVVTATIGNY